MEKKSEDIEKKGNKFYPKEIKEIKVCLIFLGAFITVSAVTFTSLYFGLRKTDFRIGLNANGGKFSGEKTEIELTVKPNQTFIELEGYETPIAEEGSHFSYWTNPQKEGIKYYENETVPYISQISTFYANYDLNEVEITIHPNGGKFNNKETDESITFTGTYGQVLNEIEGYIGEPTKESFEFLYYETSLKEPFYPKDEIKTPDEKFVLTAIYSCTHSEIEKYIIENNQLYGCCKTCKECLLINDNQLENFKGKILVEEEQDEEKIYTLFDIDKIQEIVSNKPAGSTLNLHFLYGLYDLNFYSEKEITIINNGVFKNDGESFTSTIDCTKPGPGDYPRSYGNVSFNFKNLIFQGERYYDSGFYFGIQCVKEEFNNCLFKGKQSLYASPVIFNNCTFDSTGIVKNSSDPTPTADYAIYTYGCKNGEFNNCNFKCDGKAIKVYWDGDTLGGTYTFNSCSFSSTKKNKAAIEIDSSNQLTADKPYVININNCSYEEENFNGLWSDKATPSNSEVWIDENKVFPEE